MSYRNTKPGEIIIWVDAEYANSDRDEYVASVHSIEEMNQVIENWCEKQAFKILHSRALPEFEAIKNAFRHQLTTTGYFEFLEYEKRKNKEDAENLLIENFLNSEEVKDLKLPAGHIENSNIYLMTDINLIQILKLFKSKILKEK